MTPLKITWYTCTHFRRYLQVDSRCEPQEVCSTTSADGTQRLQCFPMEVENGPLEDHEIHYKQVVNSTSMFVPGRVIVESEELGSLRSQSLVE